MKVCVLGAGASGLMAAITARRNNEDVTIINKKCLKPLNKKIYLKTNDDLNYFKNVINQYLKKC